MTDFAALGPPADLPELSSPDLPSLPKPKDETPLSPRQKAAVVVRVLLSDGKRLSLEDLPQNVQTQLVRTLADLKGINKDRERNIVAEFLNELDSGGHGAKGLGAALTMLDGSISKDVQLELSGGRPPTLRSDPWPKLNEFPSEKIANLLELESPEIAAVCLSKLSGKKAAEILGQLPGPIARRAAFTVSQIGGANPKTVRVIGRSILSQLTNEPKPAFTQNPATLVGSMLLAAKSATREDILEGLKEEDNEFAVRVRNEIFIFADIFERIGQTVVPKILREVDQAELQNALKFSIDSGARNASSAEYILDNMSKRMAEALREDLAQMNTVDEETGEASQNAVVDAIRTLEEDGTLTLKPQATEDG